MEVFTFFYFLLGRMETQANRQPQLQRWMGSPWNWQPWVSTRWPALQIWWHWCYWFRSLAGTLHSRSFIFDNIKGIANAREHFWSRLSCLTIPFHFIGQFHSLPFSTKKVLSFSSSFGWHLSFPLYLLYWEGTTLKSTFSQALPDDLM